MRYFDPTGHAIVWIREIAEDYEYDVTWDEDTKTATVIRRKDGAEFGFKTPIFDDKMYIDDKNFLYTTGEEYSTYAESMAASLRTASITREDIERIKKGSSTQGTDNSGSSVIIPEGKGTFMSYMGYHKITDKSSPQFKLREDARKSNRYLIEKPEYYALVDDRIVIATKPNIGGNFEVSIGDYLDVTFEREDGSVTIYKCIVGDFKGADAPNPWGHYDGRGVVEIIYHDYKPPEGYNANKNNPWGEGRVTRITKAGKYLQNSKIAK